MRKADIVAHGALQEGEDPNWPVVAGLVAHEVAEGRCQLGVLLCWTGTGVSIAANKVPGIRAALCVDAETARGARLWNDANVLCMSLRLTSPQVASEILDAWFSVTAAEPEELDNIERVHRLDGQRVHRS